MLDSGAMHSFVHPRVVKSMGVALLQGAALTVTMANGNQVLCQDIVELDLTFSAESGDRQVVVHSHLYMLEGLQKNAILGMDFLKRYSPQISWIDSRVVMPCLTANGAACQSSANAIAGSAACSSHADMTKCSNGRATCKNKVVVVTK